MMMKGFTLIEVVIFIVIIGLLSTGVMLGFQEVLRGSVQPDHYNATLRLAQERMELILAQRYINGFASFSNPCAVGSPPAACTLPSGYSVASSSITTDADTNFKTITVTVTGPSSTTMTLTARVANF